MPVYKSNPNFHLKNKTKPSNQIKHYCVREREGSNPSGIKVRHVYINVIYIEAQTQTLSSLGF